MAQMGFCDLSDRYASRDAKRDPLVEIDAIVPWEEFRPALERVWRKPEAERTSRAGLKPMDAVVMVKTLVLGALDNLSDDRIAYQVRDRLSFMRFLGLGLEDRVPDARTVWLYREGLAQAGMVEALFRQFDGHLARQGYIARGGQILDAAIVPVPTTRNTRDENKAIKAGEEPKGWADPAYRSEEIEAKLRARGLKGRIHRKGKRGKPLAAQGKASNRIRSTVRARDMIPGRARVRCADQRHGGHAGAHHRPDPREGQDRHEEPRL